jgi:cis-3-alkyl-4-acyloxetan-2-one decarboxylase
MPSLADLFPYPTRRHSVGDLNQASLSMAYVDEGAGEETLLCVHGNPTWSFYYRKVIQRFASTHRVIAVDHIGCGRSDKPARDQYPYTLQRRCDDLVSLIDTLDLQRVTLVAHDWGGAIGLASVVARSDRFIRIALLNTAAFPPPYVPWRIAACRIPLLGTAAVRGLNAFARLAVPMAMNRSRLGSDVAAGLLHPYDNWNHRVAIDAFVRDIPMSSHHPTMKTLQDLQAKLPTLADRPVSLIWGMKDWCFRPECLERFAKIWPHAEVTSVADAGHYVMEDAAAETLDAIDRLLKKNVRSKWELQTTAPK